MAIIPGTAKVLNQYENVNTTYGGSKAMKAQSKWYTMDDVLETVEANVAPYTVFTALVKQEGSDSPNNVGAEGPVTLGVTYYISDNSNDVDLTVFGAPNSNIGTYFICTTAGTLQNDSGILLQYNNATPVVTVLENTIGNIWFGFNTDGGYTINSDGLFTSLKTFINGAMLGPVYCISNMLVQSSGASTDRAYFFNYEEGVTTTIQLNTTRGGSGAFDVITTPICVEIRVYN